MQEMIGKVRLNLNWYNGEDRYSDGDSTENELLSIVEKPQKDYNDIIAERGSWPVLYHLSPVRENIVNWYPFRKGARVLELGSGCGAVTGALLSAGLDVCAVDLSLRRSRINATRHQDSDRLEIIVGAMEEVLSNLTEQFDYVLLIGVLEYASVFSDRDNPYAAVLTAIKKAKKVDMFSAAASIFAYLCRTNLGLPVEPLVGSKCDSSSFMGHTSLPVFIRV